MKLSAIVITKNEEKNIRDCLDSVEFADEIIVIDSNSTDKTVELAGKEGVKVYQAEKRNFSFIRNMGRDLAEGEWLFYLDADERVSKDLAKEIINAVNCKSTTAAYRIVRQNYYFSKRWPKEEEMVRLMKKNSLVGWQGILHESPKVKGEVGKLKSPLIHFTHNNLTDMVNKTNDWSNIEAELRFNIRHPKIVPWRIVRVMLTSFWQSYIQDGGFRAGTIGLIESIYQSFSMFVTYAKLWERQTKRK